MNDPAQNILNCEIGARGYCPSFQKAFMAFENEPKRISDFSIRLSRREEIPVPSRAKRGHRMVPVPLWLAPKLALYVAMREQQVNNSELARRLGVHERVVRRMIDPQHATKAERIQA
jgi:hypothetical protein